MTSLRISLFVVILSAAALAAGEAAAQVGYYRAYRPDPYRELSRTGKYHGYWRDLGYGFRSQPYDTYYYPGYGGPYYGVYDYGTPYGQITPAPNYYHPPHNYPYRGRY
jgi:hypothetical protein